MNRFMKIAKIFINFLTTLILIVGIIFVLSYAIGIEPFVVISGSMEPKIQTGSLCFINKHAKYDNVNVDDIIAYTAPTGDKITHRVINITDEGIETKGDKNNISDGTSTTPDNFIGKNLFSIPKLGYVVKLIQTPRGTIIMCTAIIAIMVATFLIDDKKIIKRKSRIDSIIEK